MCTGPPSAADPWYTDHPIGHNILDQFLKNILQEGNIDATNMSNHSLRAARISCMYQNNVLEKLIMECSGHLSKEGMMIHIYQHSTPLQQKSACNAVAGVPEHVKGVGMQSDDENQATERACTIEGYYCRWCSRYHEEAQASFS